MAAPMSRRPQSNLGSPQIRAMEPDLIQKSKSQSIQKPVKGVFNNNLILDSGKNFKKKTKDFTSSYLTSNSRSNFYNLSGMFRLNHDESNLRNQQGNKAILLF